MPVKTLYFKEGVWAYKPEFLEERTSADMTVKLVPVMRVRKDAEAFIFQMTMIFTSGETTVLHFGFVLTMKIDGWTPITSRDLTEMNPEDEMSLKNLLGSRAYNQLKDISVAAIEFSRGAAAAKSWSPDTSSLLLPSIDLERFISSIRIEVLD